MFYYSDRVFTLAILIFGVFGGIKAYAAPEFDFTYVFSEGDLDPTGTFEIAEPQSPSLRDGRLSAYFRTYDTYEDKNISTGTINDLTTVVSYGDPIPTTNDTFEAFGQTYSENNGVVFRGGGATTTGVFRWTPSGVEKIYIPNVDVLPGTPSNTNFLFREFSYSKGVAVVGGQSAAAGGFRFTGVYYDDGNGFKTVFDGNTAIPGLDVEGKGVFEAAHLGDLKFISQVSSLEGVYIIESDLNTNQHFAYSRDSLLATLEIESDSYQVSAPFGYDESGFTLGVRFGNVEFPDHAGLYRISGGTIETIVDTTVVAPESSSRFIDMGRSYAVEDGNTIFRAKTRDNVTSYGLYRTFNGAITTIIEPGGKVDGKTVETIWLSEFGMDDDSAIFQLHFTDGSYAYYHSQVVRGSDVLVPIQHDYTERNRDIFTELYDGAWIDVLNEDDFMIESLNTSLVAASNQFITSSLVGEGAELMSSVSSVASGLRGIELPTGYGTGIEVWVDDLHLGVFEEGDTILFEDYGVDSADSIRVVGLSKPDDAVGAFGVPIRLIGEVEELSVIQVPTPSTAMLLGVALVCLARRRQI